MWRASVLTLFPDMFPGPLGASLIGKGAVASDRVHRFLSDAGVVKPIAHHSPEKMKPKKKAQERAAAAEKAASAGAAQA